MEKLLIVDGMNLLFRMFFGMPARIVNSRGRAIHGTLGFVGALIKMIKRTGPTHLVALFDSEQGSDCAELFPDYKANRPDYTDVPEADNPFSQLVDIYAALDFMQIKHAETPGIEADDAIAGYALQYGGGMEVVIVSHDSDLFQLVGKNVCVLRYRGDSSVLCDAAYIEARYGVPPCRYADFKALTGDSADNIPGAKGVGPKTAAALIRQFGSLQATLDGADNITKPSVRASVTSSAARLANNYRLIRLEAPPALPFELEELACRCGGLTTGHVLEGIGLK